MPLVFPRPRRPVVSIVMPTYGRWEWTVRALGALLGNTDESYELIVVDNASPDGTASRLAATTAHVEIVRNTRNLGFGLACNQGAARARGLFLVFLNSDALVHDGWLAPLLETAGDHRVGAVGPRFVGLDGSLQEAGALLFRDATTSPYLDDPAGGHAGSSRRRVVDYVSGACLAVSREAFNRVGGFDPAFGLAYFEDVDLCLTLEANGLRTYYEPRSVVTHLSGWTPPEAAEFRDLAERNRSLLARRWPDVLSSRPPRGHLETRRIVGARDAPASDRILIVSGSASQASADTLIRELGHLCPAAQVALLAAESPPRPAPNNLSPPGVEIAGGDPDELAWWLGGRPFHYDLILFVGMAAASHAVTRTLQATQPQAWRIVYLDGVSTAGATETAAAVDGALVLAGPGGHEALVDALVEAGVEVADGVPPKDGRRGSGQPDTAKTTSDSVAPSGVVTRQRP